MPTEINLTAVKTELERVLSSKTFLQSTVLSNFLRYVVTETMEEKTNEIKEYSIAVKALGKPADFNPQLDAAIRIHAGRLRRILHEYYSSEGSNNPMVIAMQKGSYIPEFILRDNVNGLSPPLTVYAVQHTAAVNTVAVLPFKNLSGLPENDFMVDGFCEQLSADLAMYPEIAVISYFSTAKFRQEKPDIRNAGKELDVSHFITGSIFRDKKHLRVSLQLVSAETGKQLWTQTYSHNLHSTYLNGIFDDILSQVIPRLAGYYGVISRSIAFSTQLNPLLDQDTIDAVFWYYHFQIQYTEDVFQIARQRIEKALQQNPDYALGWAILGQLYIDGCALCYDTVYEPLKEANKCVQRALQLDPDCQHAYLSLAWLLVFQRDKSLAVEAIEHCVSINERSPFFLGGACFLSALLGEYDMSMEYYKQCHILNPYYPWWVNLGPVFTHFYNGNYDDALEFANCINIPGIFWHLVFRIAALGQLSRIEEATDLAGRFQNQFPGKAAEACSILKAILLDNIVYNRIKEGLNKAGLLGLLRNDVNANSN